MRRTVSAQTEMPVTRASTSGTCSKGRTVPKRTMTCTRKGLNWPGAKPSRSSRRKKPGATGRADHRGACQGKGFLSRQRHRPDRPMPRLHGRATVRAGRMLLLRHCAHLLLHQRRAQACDLRLHRDFDVRKGGIGVGGVPGGEVREEAHNSTAIEGNTFTNWSSDGPGSSSRARTRPRRRARGASASRASSRFRGDETASASSPSCSGSTSIWSSPGPTMGAACGSSGRPNAPAFAMSSGAGLAHTGSTTTRSRAPRMLAPVRSHPRRFRSRTTR